MKKKRIVRHTANELSVLKVKTDWTRFDALRDRDIDTSDIPELPEEFWKNVRIVMPKRRKKMVTLRMDEDLISWFQRAGAGYQSRINAVLREYIHSQDKRDH